MGPINTDHSNDNPLNLPPKSNDDEDRKLFLGGLSWDTSEDDIREYFNKFGQVVDVSIKYDAMTGNPRGFGFITFGTDECIDNVLKNGPHSLKNKTIDPKRAKSRPVCKKIFVGGVDANLSKEAILDYFSKYGIVENVELPYDKQRGKRREFCFIIFDTEESADLACKESKQNIGGRECDIKKAQPQPVAQQQKRMLQNQGAQNAALHLGYNYGYEEVSAIWSDSNSNRNKKRSNSTSDASQTWNYNGYFPNQGYNYSPYYPYNQGYDYYGQYGYGYDYGAYYGAYGYSETNPMASYGDSSAVQYGQTSGSGSGEGAYSGGGGSAQSSQSSHSHHNSASGKSSSRKSGSTPAYHPYRSTSSH